MPELEDRTDVLTDATGGEPLRFRDVVVPFDRCEIVVRLGPGDELLEIVEVRIRADFRSAEQRLRSARHHDVDEFYRE